VSLPLVHRLPSDFSLADAFARISCRLPGCLWLDSAAPGPVDQPGGDYVGRYSFLCADPVATLQAVPGDLDPWPQMRQWAAMLPATQLPGLPPFQGGIAGLWGYEAATWLEDVGISATDDLPTPAASIGLYDWVICHDSVSGESMLISQGLRGDELRGDRLQGDGCLVDGRRGETLAPDPDFAKARLDSVLQCLASSPALCADEPSPDNTAAQPGTADADNLISNGQFPTQRPGVWSNFASSDFRGAVAEIIARIRRGDSFQVNLAQRLITPASSDAATLYLRLRQANPAPMAGYYDGGSFQVISSSPEGFLRLRNGIVQTRPIKGTAARTGNAAADSLTTAALLASEKDRAENVMIVDLMRSDLSRVCEDDGVEVTQLCELESYAFVQHLVSVVQGRLRSDVNAIDLLAACFPGGSVTGAPKIEAMRTIAHLEPHRRGPYCGSLGYVSCSGDAEFNILIRTVTATGGYWQLPVGGGITARSVPEDEERETWLKAEGMLKATLGGIMPG
jgi:para-aminobenzoate synthetase component I